MKKIIRIIDGCLAAVLCAVFALVAVGSSALPDSVIAYSLGELTIDKIYSMRVSMNDYVGYTSDTRVSALDGEIRLFGVIPVKSARVVKTEERDVLLGGECFGIKLYSDGVMVVGTKDVETAQGKLNPAKAAGIEKGDIIISVNGEKMLSSEQVEEVFNDNNGKSYDVTLKRNGNLKTVSLTPVYSHAEGKYKVGIWVRDSTAGIGTLTFYNPVNNSLAALGHPITDIDTNELIPILNGEAVKTSVTKVYKSADGQAGSLSCDFSDEAFGSLVMNTDCGIYGALTSLPENKKLIPVAPATEVERGEATLYCTVDGEGVKPFDVKITRISYAQGSEKNLVIKVTDEALLEKTGGIVQGMSGSPVVQNGKLVGALTHVILDDPEKGYAIFADKMVEKSLNIA